MGFGKDLWSFPKVLHIFLRFASCYCFVFPGDSLLKNPPTPVGDVGSVSGLGRFLGEGNGKPLQCSCLENPIDRGAWRATVHGVKKSQA